jgi:DNA-binding LacI/PurR family transcriptional regulator
MTTTIRDVAKRAGVGLGTVSRVINDSPQVSDATRERVLSAITALNFVPNPTARRLSLGKTLTIAVIVPWFTRPAEVERLRGVENTLAESEYDLVLYNVETPEKRDTYFREVPRGERADGVLIISLSPRDDDVDRLAHSPVPIVLIDANHPSLKSLNRVITDDVAGARSATQHLIALGHTRIGFISDPIETPFNFTSSRDRLKGYRQALRAAGIPFRSDYHGQGEHGRYEARRLANQLLQLPDRPTAIFAASDTQALGVLEAAQDCELRVPEELSVIGYDDIEIAESIGLTTIRQQLYESGKRGVELLLAVLADSSIKPLHEVMPTELIIRRTTAKSKRIGKAAA